MLNTLKFVNRATSDKSIIRILTHICVHDGRLQGADSRVAIECDCPELVGESFTVPADKFIKAVAACDGNAKIEKLDDGRVKVSHKRFKAILPALKVEDYPVATIDSAGLSEVIAPDNFVSALSKIAPFIGQNASRPWTMGAWLDGTYAYATDGVTLVRTPLIWSGPPVNIPRYAVEEIISIGKPITGMRAGVGAIVVEYEGAWFKAQTYTDNWPDRATAFFDNMPETLKPVLDGLLVAIEKILPFCEDVKVPLIYFKEGCVSTADGSQTAEMGFDLEVEGVYRAETIKPVLEVATHWDPSTYPAPVFFSADKLEGLFVGVRS